MSMHPELDQLSAYLDGELEASERTTLEAHLPTCAECRSTLDALRLTVADLAALPEPVPTEQDSWALRSAIARARAPVRRWQRAAWAAGAVAAAMIAVVAIVRPGGEADSARFRETALSAGDSTAGRSELIQYGGAFTQNSAHSKLLVLAGKVQPRQLYRTAPIPASSGPTGTSTFAPAAGAGGFTGTTGEAQNLSAEDISRQIDRCVAVVQRETQQLLKPVEYDVATYESKPAFLLFFRTSERYELWVVERPSCEVLYFAQTA